MARPPSPWKPMALAALKNKDTTTELAQRFGVHPTMTTAWKRALLDGASDIFGKTDKSRKQMDSTVDELHRQCGVFKGLLIFCTNFFNLKIQQPRISQLFVSLKISPSRLKK